MGSAGPRAASPEAAAVAPRRVVVDASSLVAYLLYQPSDHMLSKLLVQADDLHVPHLCDVEFLSAVRSLLLHRDADEERARSAVDDYLALPLRRHEHGALLPRMLELRANFSGYDATYVALAEQLDALLLTDDARLARTIRDSDQVHVALA